MKCKITFLEVVVETSWKCSSDTDITYKHVSDLWKVMSNRLSDWILVKKLKGVKYPRRIQNLFLRKWAKHWLFRKRFSSYHIGVSCKLVLKSAICLTRILWVVKYWQKASKRKILSTNTKPFFWDIEAIFETYLQFSSHIAVSFKFVWRCVKSLNQIFSTRLENAQFGRRMKNHFSGKKG